MNSKPKTINSKLKVLLIEDNSADARLVQEILHEVGSSAMDVEWADRLSTGLQRAADGGIDAVLLDLSLPDSHGLETFARTHAQAPHLPIIVLSGLADEALAVKAVAEGAQDYVVKGDMDGALLARAIRYAIERHRLTTELERGQRQQLEIKDQFLSHVSHELRSPLTAVLQFVSIILDGLAGEINEEQREYLTITLRNAKQLHKMISELLEVIRSDAGKLAFDLRSVPLMELTTETIGMLLSHAAAKGVLLSADVPADLPPVYADPERLRQILINLIDNAIKFTPTKGTITVRANVWEKDPDFVCMAIADTGCGISPENTRRIFERLYQEPNTTEGDRRGLGLGLHICKELAERQGGRIWVESDHGKGSVFHFTVPIFSLAKLLHPVVTQNNTLRTPINLITVELFPLNGAPGTKITETMRREARNALQQCIVPDKNILLPSMGHSGESELFYIVECSSAEEPEATAQLVRQRCTHVKELQDPNVDVTVCTTVVEMPSTQTHPTLEEQVRSACARITELTKTVSSKKPKESPKDLYGIISTKVRTPLSVVMGYAGILQDKLLGELNPEQENALGKVLSYANDLAAMISNVVEAQRIEAGTVKVEHHEIEVADVLDELKSAYELPRAKSVTITWDYSNELPVITTDRGKLKTILQNLVNNAFKFTEQGQVTVSARISHASGLTPHAFIEFKVADTGIGIAKEQIADIFTSFRQLQTVEVNPSSGMGFGLYIVKAFTDLLGGQVAVESELGKGSVFTITIPCRREEKPYGQEKNLSRG